MPFWHDKTLEEMSEAEWESLCDRCGLCCQVRVEDEDSGEIALSNVVCRFFDRCAHQCSDYANRQQNVPDCTRVTPGTVRSLHWLPHSCAYRLLAFGHDLPEWHPLVLGDPERVHDDGPSMRGVLIGEDEADWGSRGEMAGSLPFEYYVFWSRQEAPTGSERRAGVYLAEVADSHYLRQFMDPLYDTQRIRILPSDDEIVPPGALGALNEAVSMAIAAVRRQPEEWPVVAGRKVVPFQEGPGDPNVVAASRGRLLVFLERVSDYIRRAQEAGGYIHFGGGGRH